MQYRGIFIDAQLLVLFVVGRLDPALIPRHRRLSGFSIADFDTLNSFVGETAQVFVTPNTLTEASNLLRQHGEPERGDILDQLRRLIDESREIVIASRTAANREEFRWLGLADAVLIEAASAEVPLLTADGQLYRSALDEEPQSCVNFNHLRAART